METAARKKCCFVSARRSPPLVLSAIPWIRRDMENRRSPAPSPTSMLNFRELERALGAVDVFIGHSMGGGAGGWSVRNAGFRPKLFIGVGAHVELGEHGPPVLLLAGLFEELYRPAQLQAQTNAQVVISPWCEHITRSLRSSAREGGCQSRVRCCWQTSPRCSDRVAVAIRRACAGNRGRVGLDVFACLNFIPASHGFAGLLFPVFCCSRSS